MYIRVGVYYTCHWLKIQNKWARFIYYIFLAYLKWKIYTESSALSCILSTRFFFNFLPVKVVNPLSILCISFILRAIVKEEINMDIVFCPNPTNKKKRLIYWMKRNKYYRTVEKVHEDHLNPMYNLIDGYQNIVSFKSFMLLS